jgi:hypothetical protein
MSENVGASTSHRPKGLHGLYRDKFPLPLPTFDEFSIIPSLTECPGFSLGKYGHLSYIARILVEWLVNHVSLPYFIPK